MAKPKVLIVDDTPLNISILVNTLEEEYELSAAVDGPGALKAVETEIPDIVLLDIMMPEMDGYEVCRRLKGEERTRDVPVIFITAMNDAESESKGRELGAVDYITKPFSPTVVKKRIESHIRLQRSRRELERRNAVLRDR